MKMLHSVCIIIVVVTIVYKEWIKQFRQTAITVSEHQATNQVLVNINQFLDSQCFVERVCFFSIFSIENNPHNPIL